MSTWQEISKERDRLRELAKQSDLWKRNYQKVAASYTHLWEAIENVAPEMVTAILDEELRLNNDS